MLNTEYTKRIQSTPNNPHSTRRTVTPLYRVRFARSRALPPWLFDDLWATWVPSVTLISALLSILLLISVLYKTHDGGLECGLFEHRLSISVRKTLTIWIVYLTKAKGFESET